MLVLSRKLHEEIRIGDQITIKVLQVKGNRVRIGIDAPEHVRVVRSELPRHNHAADPQPVTGPDPGQSDRTGQSDSSMRSAFATRALVTPLCMAQIVQRVREAAQSRETHDLPLCERA